MAVMACWAGPSSASSVSSLRMWALLVMALSLTSLQVRDVSASYEHTCTLDTRSRGAHPNGICGKSLSQLVSVLCQHRGYVSNAYNKRSAPSRARRDDSFVSEKLRAVLLNKKEALSYFGRKKEGQQQLPSQRHPRAVTGRSSFGSQGITCECCYNRCDIYELLQYCN